MSKIEREKRTVGIMIGIYCRGKHKTKTLCPQCADLLKYAQARLEHCPHGNSKPACAKCTIHCYSKSYREQIKEVMRYSGPRIIWVYPWQWLKHLLGQ